MILKMKFNLFLILILFIINFMLHLISEKIVILTFIIILYFLTIILSNIISEDYNLKIKTVLNDINIYINAIFTILYSKRFFLITELRLAQLFRVMAQKINLNIKGINKRIILKIQK
jgi:hypothetical protein